jgi:hypothetical protein
MKTRAQALEWLELFGPAVVAGTVLALLFSVAVQQDLRQSANDPQIQLAEDLAADLTTGTDPHTAAPAKKVDIAGSLAPFIIVFDEAGTPTVSSAQLGGRVPVVPSGVLEYVRQHGEERLTWEPRPGVRIAAVLVRYGGPRPGFVLAGRSLREVERREDALRNYVAMAWLGMVLGVGAATLLIRRLRWRK